MAGAYPTTVKLFKINDFEQTTAPSDDSGGSWPYNRPSPIAQAKPARKRSSAASLRGPPVVRAAATLREQLAGLSRSDKSNVCTAIETEGLTKRFRRLLSSREVLAVDDVSIAVRPGTAFGLLGPNGAGKTTFVKMLLSAVRPTAGTARLFGRDSRAADARRVVGYLPENHRFPTYNTGRQMLDFHGALAGMSSARRRETAELLELVGLADRAHDRIGKYSKGMLQRLGLAQALLNSPRLLVLDEPGDEFL